VKSSQIAGLQLPTLPMSESKLDYYFRICAKKEISLIVLGEYVLNSFFKELEKMPKSMINEQTKHKISILKSLCIKYSLTVVAPLVLVKKDGFKKVTARFTPKGVNYYPQYWLIDFKHWNEDEFFLPYKGKYKLPVLIHEGFRCAIVNGFEAHFDNIWQEVRDKSIDIVLMPSASTFGSNQRWEELLKTRAFLNNVYILRVNRVGSFDKSWDFYGQSMLINPNGEIEVLLNDKEELLISRVEKSVVKQAQKEWGFKKQLKKRGLK